ncbi:MAG: FAD-dependent thymidylate synthase [Candidatus Delongbacteria bacterium]|jgi:flavin-dependent thymidylate synthase|nr:FAD-dependent thymidylate synthase [Candidatus Delongbacteria bacterium]
MKVILSGYNLDSDTIEEMKEKSGWDKDNISPETLSAAYARISRDPRDIDVLRKAAREEVEKSRKSNQAIIFGLGHSSVAEHAYFNFDIIGLSRFAVEYVQKFRFASYTEKSQRYITLEDDYITPKEIIDAGFESEFNEVVRYQNEVYQVLYKDLQEYLFKTFPEEIKTKNGKRTVDGWAKEDARYVVSMATESQFGMSINARSLENMLREFGSSPLNEIQELGKKLYELVKDLSPSIIKYVEPTDYDIRNPQELKEFAKSKCFTPEINHGDKDVTLLNITPNTDDTILTVILSSQTGMSFGNCNRSVQAMSDDEKEALFKRALNYRMAYDSVSRHFEFADALFEINISSTNYAQLKRHRIASIITHPYDIDLGTTLPPNIEKINRTEEFNAVIKRTEKLFGKLQEEIPEYSQYILTNAHKRKILVKMNFRELYHFMSLRLDQHAQWDIRKIAEDMKEEIIKHAPLTSMMFCGKSEFEDQKRIVFGE